MGRSLALTLAVSSALALASCGGGGSTTIIRTVASQPTTSTTSSPTSTSTTSPKTTTSPSTSTTPMHHFQSFQAASGNLGCIVNRGTVRCDIKNRSWNPPPRPASCPNEVDFGQGIEVGGGPARFVCAGDTALNPTAPRLASGEATSSGDLICTAIANLITCSSKATGHGFTMSSASYKLY